MLSKYYVYRLVDPRTLQTFYVGKGINDRAEQHAKGVKQLIANGEDPVSLKQKQIVEIIAAGKEVIVVIHRRDLTNKEALEVEAALIDAYPGLTNIQGGYGIDRGMILLQDIPSSQPYSEPAENYVIIKIRQSTVQTQGSIYDAVRYSWVVNLKTIKKYKHVLAVINGIVREVYDVDKWYQISATGRVAFDGRISSNTNLQALKNQLIPAGYRRRGASNPVVYKK